MEEPPPRLPPWKPPRSPSPFKRPRFFVGYWVRRIPLSLSRRWLRFKWWWLMGGEIKRHPHHYTVWTATLAVFAGFAGIFLFTTRSWFWHACGWGSAGVAAYIAGSFFAPLWLPKIRDESEVFLRRAAVRSALEKKIKEYQEKQP